MIFLTRYVLPGIIISLIFLQTVQAQHKASATAWYRDYFTSGDHAPVETLLHQKEKELFDAREIRDDSARVFVLLQKGLIQLNYAYNYEAAMDCFLQSLGAADSASLPSGEIFAYLALAHIFEQAGNPEKSLQFLERSFALAYEHKHPEILALVLNELGKASTSAGKLEDALEHYEHALRYKDQLPDSGLEAETLHNLANLFVTKRDFTQALDFFKQSLAIRRKQRLRLEEGMLLNEIGTMYNNQNNRERAYANYVAALEVYQSIDYKKGIAEAYNHIGEHYLSQKSYTQAIANLELALTAAQSAQAKAAMLKSYEYLSIAYKALNNFQQALKYKEQQLSIHEFIVKEESDQKLLETQSTYALQQKESEIEQLDRVRKERERELAEQKRLQGYLYALLGLGVVIAGLILYLYILKQRSNRQLQSINAQIEAQNTQLQTLNNTKDKFFSIIGHDLKGPLNSLTSFSNLLINHFDALSKEEIQNIAKDLEKSLKNLFALLNNLLEWARSQTGNIDFTAAPINIIDILEQNKELLQQQASAKDITILYEPAELLTASAHAASVTTVVRNLISNSIKFTPSGGAIKLTAQKNADEVIVSVADTGVGMSKAVMDKLFRLDAKHSTLGTANEKGTGLGLILCKDFVEKNGGRLWMESEEGKGSTFYFSLPLMQS
ncbi:MAG: tetratricopeptide repeat-containing sensor histidine kinase [Cyclobacteriaceae bacterium]|nr:tetratricopeptide repeat-containing sensor histidine kinase [Cyclobacteriaceae bacterium]